MELGPPIYEMGSKRIYAIREEECDRDGRAPGIQLHRYDQASSEDSLNFSRFGDTRRQFYEAEYSTTLGLKGKHNHSATFRRAAG